jgi:heme/copper-type cytochrome/quinol oxidase subunit 1
MGGMTAAQSPSPRPARAANLVLAALGLVGLVLLGAAAWVSSRPVTYGWFAYAPLSESTYVPGPAFVPGGPGLPVLLATGGALALGAVVGYVVGRRGRPASPVADGGAGPGDVGP